MDFESAFSSNPCLMTTCEASVNTYTSVRSHSRCSRLKELLASKPLRITSLSGLRKSCLETPAIKSKKIVKLRMWDKFEKHRLTPISLKDYSDKEFIGKIVARTPTESFVRFNSAQIKFVQITPGKLQFLGRINHKTILNKIN